MILCEKIDQEINLKKQEFLQEAECEDLKQDEGPCVTFAVKKEAVDRLESAYEKFNSLSLNHQEENIHTLRQQLLKRLGRAKSFDAKTQFINNKIEYDQRFFNHGYSEQQKLISDIRKQIRLNKEILRLKNKAKSVCDHIQDDEEEPNSIKKAVAKKFAMLVPGLNSSEKSSAPGSVFSSIKVEANSEKKISAMIQKSNTMPNSLMNSLKARKGS